MKLLVLTLLLLAAAVAAADDPCSSTTDHIINNRKLKLAVVHGDFMMHPEPADQREYIRVQRQLPENPNGGTKNAAAAIGNGGVFSHDAMKAGESVDSNVDQATEPTVADARGGSKQQINDYPAGSGAGLDSHHTIDLQNIWNKQHPPKPSN